MVEWGPIRGRVVFDSGHYPFAEQLSRGFSLVGRRHVLLTDAPAAYVSDSGGPGGDSVARLDPAGPGDIDLELLPGTLRVRAALTFPDGKALRFTTGGPLHPGHVDVLVGLAGAVLAQLGPLSFVTPVALPVVYHFEPEPAPEPDSEPAPETDQEADQEAGPETDSSPAAAGQASARQSDDTGSAATEPATPSAAAPAQGLASAPVPASAPTPAAAAAPESASTPAPPAGGAEAPTAAFVVLRDGRLGLERHGRRIVDWPLNRVRLLAVGPAQVAIHGGAVLADRRLTGVVLDVPHQLLRTALLGLDPGSGSGSGSGSGQGSAAATAAAPEKPGAAAGRTTVATANSATGTRTPASAVSNPAVGTPTPATTAAAAVAGTATPPAPAKPASAAATQSTATPPTTAPATKPTTRPAAVPAANPAPAPGKPVTAAAAQGTATPPATAPAPAAGKPASASTGSGSPGTAATTARAVVAGAGAAPGATVECTLDEQRLVIRTGEPRRILASVDLTQRDLRLAGSTERFVLAAADTGPLSVASSSQAFARRLLEHPAVQAAAVRTLTEGPYPVETADGEPVVVSTADGAPKGARGVRVRGPSLAAELSYDSLREPAPDVRGSRTSLRLASTEHEVTLVGQTELIQAVHTRIWAGGTPTASPEQVPDLLCDSLDLEEEYLLSAVFGPLYELHAALLSDLGLGALDRRLDVPQSTAEQERTTAVLATGLAELRRHYDHVAHVLAPFVRSRDAWLAAPVAATEPAWLKAAETTLRTALAPVERVAAEVDRLLGMTSRLPGGDLPLPRADDTGAAGSLGTATLAGPVFAAARLSRAVSPPTEATPPTVQATGPLRGTWQAILGNWQALLTDLVPGLSYTVTENAVPVRREVARQLGQLIATGAAEGREQALRRLAHRLAVLDVSRRYPATPAVGISRDVVVQHLRALREQGRTPRFVAF